jgi:hypothetical protein
MKRVMPDNGTTRTVILALALCLAIGLNGGCVSTTLPPRITEEQRALLHKTQFGLTIGVEDPEDGLVMALGKTHLFARVDHLKNFTMPPDLVARVEEKLYGTATIPIWTGLSFGIIPTTVNESWGYSFSIRRSGTDAPGVPIRFVYSGPTTLGWWAIVLNMLPDRTMRDADNHPRFIESLAWTITAKQNAIESLNAK